MFPVCFRRHWPALAALCAAPLAAGHALPQYIVDDQAWQLWPNGVIYYSLESRTVPADGHGWSERRPVDAAARQALREAMRHLSERTDGALRFVEAPARHDRLQISLMPWHPDRNLCGQASVGHRDGAILQIADLPGCKTRAVALHELMHTLGFLHENQRFQALMDVGQRDRALAYYADKSDALDHDSITYNDGIQGERLDRLSDATDVLVVRLRYGMAATGRWFQELSKDDVAALKRFYGPAQTIAGKLARARRDAPHLDYRQLALDGNRCLAAGARLTRAVRGSGRQLFAPPCDRDHASQRWAFTPAQRLVNLDYPGLCLGRLSERERLGSTHPRAHRFGEAGFAILDTCRPGDPNQGWLREGLALKNRAHPELYLGYEPGNFNVLAWPRRHGLVTDWTERNQPPTGDRPPLAAAPAASQQSDPWRLPLVYSTGSEHAIYQLRHRQRCLTAEPGDHRLFDQSEHHARLRPCTNRRDQLWMLRNQLLESLRYPGHCLGSTGLTQPADEARPTFAGLKRCNRTQAGQRWMLQGVKGTAETLITARVNPLADDSSRVLTVSGDRVYFGYLRRERDAYSWQVSRRDATGLPPPAATPQAPPPAGLDNAQIVLLGGGRAMTGERHCLTALDRAPPGFATGEKEVDVRRCAAGRRAQHWTLRDDGWLVNAANPGLCLGRNRNKRGKISLSAYPALGYKSTGQAVLQACIVNEPSQRWQWRATRFFHQGDDKTRPQGEQLVLRDTPQLTLVLNTKDEGPRLAIDRPDPARLARQFRWRQPAVLAAGRPLPLAPPTAGPLPLDWMPGAGSWQTQTDPRYAGQNRNRRPDGNYRALRWLAGSLCLTDLGPATPGAGTHRLGVATCRPGVAEQQWRFDDRYRLVNQRDPSRCVVRQGLTAVLRDCRGQLPPAHWFFNDSHQIESLDVAPLPLGIGTDRQVAFADGRGGNAIAVQWVWVEGPRRLR